MPTKLPHWLCSRIDPIELLLRIVLGGILVLAGWEKIKDPGLFSLDVRNYQILSDPWNAWAAMALPPFEIIAGCSILLRVLYLGSLVAVGVVLLGFIAALTSLLVRKLDIECGCLGFSFPLQIQILIDVALIAIVVVLLWMARRATRSTRAG